MIQRYTLLFSSSLLSPRNCRDGRADRRASFDSDRGNGGSTAEEERIALGHDGGGASLGLHGGRTHSRRHHLFDGGTCGFRSDCFGRTLVGRAIFRNVARTNASRLGTGNCSGSESQKPVPQKGDAASSRQSNGKSEESSAMVRNACHF